MFEFSNNKNSNKRNDTEQQKNSTAQLYTSIDENISLLNSILSKNPTIHFRSFEVQIACPIKCCMIFLDEMANRKVLNENILEPLMHVNINTPIPTNELLDFFVNKVIISHNIEKITDVDELVGAILYGDAVLFINGIKEALVIDSKGWEARSISPPLSESTVRGPREGFTESFKVNISLIRRRIRNPELKFEFTTVGAKTKTQIAICYIEGTANEKIINELKKRLNTIKIDGILESGCHRP